MAIDSLIPELERLESDGAIILLKFDGERESNKKTVLVQKPGTDYLFRKDTDNLEEIIIEAIKSYDFEFSYPIKNERLGWRFRINETSNNAFMCEGVDKFGRKVSATGSDPESLIKKLELEAENLIR